MMEKIYSYLAPFLAAGIASWLTYALAMRQRKQELLIQERLAAFKAIQERLVSIRRYCEAGLGEQGGSDFAARFESLPQSDPRSALLHASALQDVIDKNSIFVSQKGRVALKELTCQLALLCTMELAIASDPSIKSSSENGYNAGARAVDVCIGALYEELRLPD